MTIAWLVVPLLHRAELSPKTRGSCLDGNPSKWGGAGGRGRGYGGRGQCGGWCLLCLSSTITSIIICASSVAAVSHQTHFASIILEGKVTRQNVHTFSTDWPTLIVSHPLRRQTWRGKPLRRHRSRTLYHHPLYIYIYINLVKLYLVRLKPLRAENLGFHRADLLFFISPVCQRIYIYI